MAAERIVSVEVVRVMFDRSVHLFTGCPVISAVSCRPGIRDWWEARITTESGAVVVKRDFTCEAAGIWKRTIESLGEAARVQVG